MPLCSSCGKTIDGAHMNACGKSYHLQCFTCRGCGERIYMERYLEHEGYPYHAPCHAKQFSSECAHCGKLIVGAYRTTAGKAWHEPCFLCMGCRRPLNQSKYLEKNGDPYHHECFRLKFHPPCQVCGKTLTRQFLINGWDEYYCNHHPKELAPCYSCRRLISKNLTNGGKTLDDGRQMCNICMKSAVLSANRAADKLFEVLRGLSGHGIEVNNPIVSLAAQKDLLPHVRVKLPIPPKSALKLTRAKTGSNAEILIVHSLPVEHFQAMAAHEIGRVWLMENGCVKLSPKYEEGFCTFCEYLWLKDRDDKGSVFHRKAILYRSDKILGAGFKAYRDAAGRMSLPKLLAYMKQRRRFPSRNPLVRLFG